MENLVMLAQMTVAASVAYVWIFRFHNVLKEFNQFGLSHVTRNLIGVIKNIFSYIACCGYLAFIISSYSFCSYGAFNDSAQYFHFKIKNSFIKHLPSLILLLLCAFIALFSI